MSVISELKVHNESMYTHSLRVGLYALGIASSENQSDLSFPLFAGCGHDIGKCEIDNALLDSKNMQRHEFEQIKTHAIEGYAKLKDSFLFTALIAGLHHKYKTDGYGIDLEENLLFGLDDKAKTSVKAMAKLIMIADFFDALTTRDNNKGFIADPQDPRLQREVMTNYFPDSKSRIEWLVAHKI